MSIILLPIDQVTEDALTQQLVCWARTDSGMIDSRVTYQSCCTSVTGETVGRYQIPGVLCGEYGPLPFTSQGNPIPCDPDSALQPFIITSADVAPIDPNTCQGTGGEPLPAPTGLTATDISDTSIALIWNPVPEAVVYLLQYSTDGGATWLQQTASGPPAAVTGLTPETTYTIRIAAATSPEQTNVNWSEPITATTIESTPTGLNVIAGPGQGELVAVWNAVPTALSYTVSWSLPGGPVIGTATVNDPTYAITGLADQTTYVITVAADDSQPTSADGNTRLAQVADLAVGNITTTTATATWTNVGAVDSFDLALDPAIGTIVMEPGFPEQAHLIELTPAMAYTFSAIATDTTGTWPNSTPVTIEFTTAALTVLPMPGLQQVSWVGGPNDLTVGVSWDTETGGDPNGIRLVINPGDIVETFPPGSTSYEFESVVGTPYEYTVVAIGDGVVNADSAPLEGQVTYIGQLADPSTVTATSIGQTSISVTWPSVEHALTYTVQVVDTATGDPVASVPNAVSPQAINDLTAGTGYTVSVVAQGEVLSEELVSVLSSSSPGAVTGTVETDPVPQPLPTPTLTLVSYSGTDTGMTLDWAAAQDPNGSRVTLEPGEISQAVPSGISEFEFTGLAVATPYTYTVTAIGDGTTSLDSSALAGQVTLSGPLPDPATITAVSTGQTSISVTWSTVTGATQYIIQVFQGTTQVASVENAVSPQAVNGLSAGTVYTVSALAWGQVQSSDADAVLSLESPGENVSSVTTAPVQLAAPTGVTATAGPDPTTEIEVDWNTVAFADDYRVEYSTDGTTWDDAPMSPGEDPPMVIAGLTPGTPYQFRVFASDTTGVSQESAPSATVSATTQTAGD